MELGRRKINLTATAVQLNTVYLVFYVVHHLGIFQMKGQHRAVLVICQTTPYAFCQGAHANPCLKNSSMLHWTTYSRVWRLILRGGLLDHAYNCGLELSLELKLARIFTEKCKALPVQPGGAPALCRWAERTNCQRSLWLWRMKSEAQEEQTQQYWTATLKNKRTKGGATAKGPEKSEQKMSIELTITE